MKQPASSPEKRPAAPRPPARRAYRARAAAPAATETVDLALRLLERLADAREPVGVSALAREFDSSKATVYRHVQTMARHGFVRQDPATSRYQAGVKLFILGERLRDRFDLLAAARKEMAPLRDGTGQAVTVSALVEDQVIVLELLQGRTIVEFGTRPGTVLDLHASAHGKVALAFGPAALQERSLERPLKPWTPQTIRTRPALERAIAQVRGRGWATAPNEVLPGVNALAAPILDHRGAYAGALAIVGSTQYIAAAPTPQQIALVTGAAQRISRELGFGPR